MIDDPRMWRSIQRLEGSETLDPTQVGVDGRYSLTAHYEVVMPGSYETLTEGEGKVWSEPLLVLLISVTHSDWPPEDTRVLYYGLTRSLWVSSTEPSPGDQAKLMAAAVPFLRTDIEQLGAADVPDSLSMTRSL